MCPHGYHHSGFMVIPALGMQDVHLAAIYIHEAITENAWTGSSWNQPLFCTAVCSTIILYIYYRMATEMAPE